MRLVFVEKRKKENFREIINIYFQAVSRFSSTVSDDKNSCFDNGDEDNSVLNLASFLLIYTPIRHLVRMSQ